MLLPAALAGLGSGVLSGMFGIGGGILTTPAIRALGYAELVAVGTPLPVIVPTALAGAIAHARHGTCDVRDGLVAGAAGAVFAAPGAMLADVLGGRLVLLATAALILWTAADVALGARREASGVASSPGATGRARTLRLTAIGAAAGLASGLLGLGGGFLLVPAFVRFAAMSAKRAAGTSLVAVSLIVLPGTLTHALLGHVDWRLAGALTLGVVPGALLGARLNRAASESAVRFGFAAVLLAAGAWLALHELGMA